MPLDLPPPSPCLVAGFRSDRPDAIGSIVSDRFPIRVHWDRIEDEPKAAIALDYAELAWEIQVEQLGFNPPVLPDAADGPELDIYFDAIGAFQAWAYAPSYSDSTTGDGMMGAAAYMAIDRDLPLGLLGSYIAHEFNHVLQYATDFTEPTLPLWEATATAAQKWTLGAGGEWETEVYSFQEAPWAPALVGDSYRLFREGAGLYFEYGASFWVMHLDEVFGDGDGMMGPALWAAAANEGWSLEPDAVDAFIEISGSELPFALNELARTRWLVGKRWDERGLRDAKFMGAAEQVPLDAWLLEAELPVVHAFSPALQVTGQGFLRVEAGQEGTLHVGVSSARELRSGLLVLWWDEDGGTGELQDGGLNPSVSLALDGISRVVVAVSNAGGIDWDGEDDAYIGGDQLVSIDIARSTAAIGEEPPTEEIASSGCSCDARSRRGPWAFLMPLVMIAYQRRRPAPA